MQLKLESGRESPTVQRRHDVITTTVETAAACPFLVCRVVRCVLSRVSSSLLSFATAYVYLRQVVRQDIVFLYSMTTLQPQGVSYCACTEGMTVLNMP